MEIHLIRHPQVNVPSGICYGQTDVDLSKEGLDAVANLQLNETYDLFYSSPLERCKVLADSISDQFIMDERLQELNFGTWEMKSWEAIPKDEIDPWYEDYIHTKATNGESLMDLVTRVQSFILNELNENKANKILIVTHAGVIRVFLHLLTNVPLDKIFDYQPTHCKRTILVKKEQSWKLKQYNQ